MSFILMSLRMEPGATKPRPAGKPSGGTASWPVPLRDCICTCDHYGIMDACCFKPQTFGHLSWPQEETNAGMEPDSIRGPLTPRLR